MKKKTFISIGLFGVWLSSTSAQANDIVQLSQGSTNVSVAFVTGSTLAPSGRENLIVKGMETASESVAQFLHERNPQASQSVIQLD